MIWAIDILVFAAVFALTLGIYLTVSKETILIHQRLAALAVRKKQHVRDEELERPFFERAIKPLLEKSSRALRRFLPSKKASSLSRKLLLAGNPYNLTPNEFLLLQYGLTLVLPILVFLFALPAGLDGSVTLLAMAGAAIAGYMVPDYYLKMKAAARKEEIERTLPDVLDLLTVSVEAGLGFDAALVKVVEKVKGVLAEEFNRVLQEVKMGKPRREALRDMAQRCGSDELMSFVGAVIQADQLGVSIGNVLRLQSEQMRSKRRQKAEEKAMKAPIKMLIPLIIFIFPTIFIVVLGPALIQIIQGFNR